MGKRNRNKARMYLEKLVATAFDQQEALEQANNKVVTLKLEKMLLCDAYNYLVKEVEAKLTEAFSADEAEAWLENRSIKKLSVNKNGSDLISLIQDYVDDEPFEDE